MLKLADHLKLPTAVATQATAILGIRGSGKTNTAGVLAEELLAIGQPVVIIDPTDVWWGLRSSADGKAPAWPILIAGGSHGDLPLAENDGKALAEFLVAEQVPAILSIRHLRKAAQRRFFVALAEEMYHLKGRDENRSAMTLIVDEAGTFAPQDVRGDAAASVGAIEDIVARGRNAGFGVVLINPRAATLNKNCMNLCDTLVLHRMPAPQDRKAVMGWVEEAASDEQAAEVLASMARLANGNAWFWSPALDICQRVQVRLKKTFDSSRTPGIGEAVRKPKKLAEIDLAALKGKMATSIEQAKANDPKLLKARIAELEKALQRGAGVGGREPGKLDAAAVERITLQATKAAEKRLADEIRTADRKLAQAAKILRQITGLASGPILAELEASRPQAAVLPAPAAKAPANLTQRHRGTEQAIAPLRASVPLCETSPRRSSGGDGNLPRMQREFLTCLAQHPAGLSKGTLLAITGYSSNGATSSAFAAFMAQGWAIAPQPGSLSITDAGLAALGPYDPLPTGAALRDLRLNHRGLSIFETKVLEQLFEAYPDGLAKGEILRRLNYSSNGATSSAFAKLAKMGWAEKSRPGELRAAEFFFAD